jgi:hypothetical protein
MFHTFIERESTDRLIYFNTEEGQIIVLLKILQVGLFGGVTPQVHKNLQ